MSGHPSERPWSESRRSFAAGSVAWLCALALAAGCAPHGISAPTGGSELTPSQVKLSRQVEVAAALQRDLTYEAHTVGTLEPDRQTSIASGVPGVVDEVLFKEGDLVTPETILVRIDQEKYRSAAALAKANEERAEARVAMTKDFAQRAGRLSEQRAGAPEEATKWQQEFKVAKAEQSAAEAARQLAERDLAKSQVRAPYAGQINQRRVAPGDFVKDETVIATIADISKLRLTTWVPEMAAARVHIGDMLKFELEALPRSNSDDPCFQAKIFFLSTVADPQTHMFECKAEIAQPDLEMKPGLFARVHIATEQHRNACVVPEESVRASDQGFVVFVPKRSTGKEGQSVWIAERRRVQLGFRSPGFVEVLKGVEPGERVVTRGAEALDNGVPIEFRVEEPAVEATADADGKKNGKT